MIRRNKQFNLKWFNLKRFNLKNNCGPNTNPHKKSFTVYQKNYHFFQFILRAIIVSINCFNFCTRIVPINMFGAIFCFVSFVWIGFFMQKLPFQFIFQQTLICFYWCTNVTSIFVITINQGLFTKIQIFFCCSSFE